MKSARCLVALLLSLLFFAGCGEEASPPQPGAEVAASPAEEPATITAGTLSLTPPSVLWNVDEELVSMITLKYGESSPRAVARFYFNGRDDLDYEKLSESKQEKFLEELAYDLRGQIEQATESQAEFISGPEYLTEPYPGVSWRYQDTLGNDDYFNLDTVFYADGRYAFLDIACYFTEREELTGELERLRASAVIKPEETEESRILKANEHVQLHRVSLTVNGSDWRLTSSAEELFLNDDDSTLHLYRRQPRTGTSDGGGLLDGLRREIATQWGEVEFLERQLLETEPLIRCALEYRSTVEGESLWHYDSILITEDDYYLLEAESAGSLSPKERERLIELVESLAVVN
jgi:hypothetical protein